jgi:hypothetical protein
MKTLLDLNQATPDGRFRVVIESCPQGDVPSIGEAVQSLMDLHDILAEASTRTLKLAQEIFVRGTTETTADDHSRSRPSTPDHPEDLAAETSVDPTRAPERRR